MRIIIFSQYYNPERFLINEIAPELVRKGHGVTVITGTPNYPEGKIYSGYEHGKRKKEIINGVKVLRTKIVPRGKNLIQLLLNYMSFMLKAYQTATSLKEEYDVVFLYQLTPIFQAFPAIKYARKHKKKILCYCLDLAPASGEDVAGKLHFLFSLYRRFSKWAYSNCDRIAVTSKGFIDYLNSVHGVEKEKITYLPQHAPESLLYEDLRKTNTDGIPDFLFAGNIGYGSRLDYVIDAAFRLKKQGLLFRIHFVGNGSDKARLVEMVRKMQLEEIVFFHDPVPMSEMNRIYKNADALIVTLRKGQITIPSKVQAYMATGKPILGAMDGSGKDLINFVGCGKCVDAENVDQITNMIKEYIQCPDIYANCGDKGKQFFNNNFKLDIYIEKLIDELLSLSR